MIMKRRPQTSVLQTHVYAIPPRNEMCQLCRQTHRVITTVQLNQASLLIRNLLANAHTHTYMYHYYIQSY